MTEGKATNKEAASLKLSIYLFIISPGLRNDYLGLHFQHLAKCFFL